MLKTNLHKGLLILGATVAMGVSSTFAQDAVKTDAAPAEVAVTDFGASCFLAPAKASDSELSDFLKTPAKLLSDNASGGLPLENRVRTLAGSSSKAVDAIVGLLSTASDLQKDAIGKGLAKVRVACAANNPAYVDLLSAAIAASADTALITAFLSTPSDTQTAAVGGTGTGSTGGAIGGGSVGGTSGQTGGSNSAQVGGDATTGNTGGSFSVGSSGGMVSNGTNTISTVTQ